MVDAETRRKIHIKEFVEYLGVQRKLSLNTIHRYRCYLRHYGEWLSGAVGMSPFEVNSDILFRYVLYMRKDRGISISACRVEIAAVFHYYRWLVEEEVWGSCDILADCIQCIRTELKDLERKACEPKKSMSEKEVWWGVLVRWVCVVTCSVIVGGLVVFGRVVLEDIFADIFAVNLLISNLWLILMGLLGVPLVVLVNSKLVIKKKGV